MKNLIKLFALCIVCFVYSQNPQQNSGFQNNGMSALQAGSVGDARALGSSSTFYNPKRKVEGSEYLFDEWNNSGIIYTSDKKRYSVNSVNLNLKRNTLEAKFSGDSLFVFNFNNIEKFSIKGKAYKNFYYDDDVKIYELVFDSEEFKLLKGYKLKFVEGSSNPMLARTNDRYIKKDYYFIYENDKISPFKLNKKKILKLVGDDKVEALLAYADKNKLSFKKENEVRQMFEYIQ